MSLPPFQAFYDQHRRSVHRFMVASLGRQDAEDCFQETFLSALRAYPRLNGDSNLRAWIFTIAHNKVIDSHRSRARRAVPMGEMPERPVEQALAVEPELWLAVEGLPSKQRAAVLLRFVSDLPYADIARVMGGSVDAARQNVHQALKKLREVWRP